jgi:hypothetical protein
MRDNIITLLALTFIAIISFIGYSEGYRRGSESQIVRAIDALYALESRDNIEYQIMLEADSIVVWQDQRHVGTIPYGNSAIDSLFIKDNQ